MTDIDRRRILGKTEGNPLFLQEVARALIDGGLVERADSGWRLTGDTAEIAIPDTIQSLITVGLDRLPDSARRTVQTAAVIGRTFAEGLLDRGHRPTGGPRRSPRARAPRSDPGV